MKRILVIDDEYSITQMLEIMLQVFGYEVTTLNDGFRALSLHREKAFDLVITDMLMPGMDGLETIRTLKREFPDLKIIGLSGGGFLKYDRNPAATAWEVGICRFFFKPVSMYKLIGAIQEELL